jgi:predicted DsbA family dithiol-disulfide isomerase
VFASGTLSDHATLTSLAVEVDLPEARVTEVLASTAYTAEVAADQAQALAYGANGVPFFVIDEKYVVSGAQPVEVFQEALRRAQADRKPVTLVTGPAARPTPADPTAARFEDGYQTRRARLEPLC